MTTSYLHSLSRVFINLTFYFLSLSKGELVVEALPRRLPLINNPNSGGCLDTYPPTSLSPQKEKDTKGESKRGFASLNITSPSSP